MRKFQVIALSLSGKGRGKIYSSGDVVTQEQVNAPVDSLVKSGFLKEITEGVEDPSVPTEELNGSEALGHDFINPDPNQEAEVQQEVVIEQEVKDPLEETEEVESEENNDLLNELKKEEVGSAPESDENVVKVPSLEEVNYKFLIKELENLGVTHSKNISKKEAYELWIEAKKVV